MKNNQLTKAFRGASMYIEKKDDKIDGVAAKTGLTVYYRGRVLTRAKGAKWLAITLIQKLAKNTECPVSKRKVPIPIGQSLQIWVLMKISRMNVREQKMAYNRALQRRWRIIVICTIKSKICFCNGDSENRIIFSL